MNLKKIHFPSKEMIKTKSVTVLIMFFIIASLYSTCYMLFFRTVEVDVTKDAAITYRGESDSATVKVDNKNKNYNQRIQEFMDSITYKTTPETNLKNGDTITITANYNQELANRYHIQPIQKVRKVIIGNLPTRYEHVDEIPQAFLKRIDTRGKKYLDKNIDAILREDFTSFHIKAEPELIEESLIYRVFLDSNGTSSKDRLLDVFAITAKGDVNVSNEKEVLEEKEETIYYMITYNEVNTSQAILDENVYGEKLILNRAMDLRDVEVFTNYMMGKYGSGYGLSFIALQ